MGGPPTAENTEAERPTIVLLASWQQVQAILTDPARQTTRRASCRSDGPAGGSGGGGQLVGPEDPAILLTVPESAVDAPGLRDEVSQHQLRLSEAAGLIARGGISADQLGTISTTCRTLIAELQLTLHSELASAALPSPLSVFTSGDGIAVVW